MDPITMGLVGFGIHLIRKAINEGDRKEAQRKEELAAKYPEAAKANQEAVDEMVRVQELEELARLQAKYRKPQEQPESKPQDNRTPLSDYDYTISNWGFWR